MLESGGTRQLPGPNQQMLSEVAEAAGTGPPVGIPGGVMSGGTELPFPAVFRPDAGSNISVQRGERRMRVQEDGPDIGSPDGRKRGNPLTNTPLSGNRLPRTGGIQDIGTARKTGR